MFGGVKNDRCHISDSPAARRLGSYCPVGRRKLVRMAREGLASQDSGVEKTAGEGALFKMGDPFRMRRQEAAASTSLEA